MTLPPYKADYEPLYKAMRKLKKTNQIKSLSMGPPMGAIPPGVGKDLAAEFTGTFCAVRRFLFVQMCGGSFFFFCENTDMLRFCRVCVQVFGNR